MNKNPLVSVVVVTYNSSRYVTETLDSIYLQSYNNIELIITDDCSTDNTEAVCLDWIKEKTNRFVNFIFIKTNRNSGVAANVNNGIKKSKGEYIKTIAGDDLLLKDCISINVQYIIDNPATEITFSRCKPFGLPANLLTSKNFFKYSYFNLDNRTFLYFILRSNFIPASTSFYKRTVFDNIGYFIEEIPLLEDWPFWIKAVYNKICINFIDVNTVLYRTHDSSLSNSSIRSIRYMESENLAKKFALSYQWKVNKLLWLNTIASNNYTICKNRIKKLFWLLVLFINPITYYLKYRSNQANKFEKNENSICSSVYI